MSDKSYFVTVNGSTPTADNGKLSESDLDSDVYHTLIPMFQPTSEGTDITQTGVCSGQHCPFFDDPTVMYADEDASLCRCADVLRYGKPYSMLFSTGSSKYPKTTFEGTETQMFWLNYIEPGASSETDDPPGSQGGSVNVTPVQSQTSIKDASMDTLLNFISTTNEPSRAAYFTFHSPIFPDGMPIKAGPQGAFYVMQHPDDTSGTSMSQYANDQPTVWGTKFAQTDSKTSNFDSANYRYYNWVCAQSYDAIPFNAGLSGTRGQQNGDSALPNTACFQRNSESRSVYSDIADFNGGGQWPPLFYFDAMWLTPNLNDISSNVGKLDSDNVHDTTSIMTSMSGHKFYNRQRYAKSPDAFPDQQPYVMATLPYAMRSTVGWYLHFGSAHDESCGDNVTDSEFAVNTGLHYQRLDTWATVCDSNDSFDSKHNHSTVMPFSVFQVIPYIIDKESGSTYGPESIYIGQSVSETCNTDSDCTSCDGTTCYPFVDSDNNNKPINQKCKSTGYMDTSTTDDYVSKKKYCAPVQATPTFNTNNINNGNPGPFISQTDMFILGGIGILLLVILSLAVYWGVLHYREGRIKAQDTTTKEKILSNPILPAVQSTIQPDLQSSAPPDIQSTLQPDIQSTVQSTVQF